MLLRKEEKNDLYEWKEDIKIRKHNFKVFLQKFNERKI